MKQDNNDSMEAKLDRIMQRVKDSIPDDQVYNVAIKDCKYHNLEVDLQKAKKKNNYLSIAIIKRQLTARVGQILDDMTEEKIRASVGDGTIMLYLDDKDREQFNYCRTKYLILLDAVDSILNDTESILRGAGLHGSLALEEPIATCRKRIGEDLEQCGVFLSGEFADIYQDESDKAYKYIERRMQPFMKKIAERYEQSHPDETLIAGTTIKPKEDAGATKKNSAA